MHAGPVPSPSGEFTAPRPPGTEVDDCANVEQARIAAHLAPVMIWMSGADGVFSWCNASCETFTGEDCHVLCGGGWLDRIHPEDQERYTGILAANLQARQSFELDYRLRHRDGAYRWVMDTGTPRFAEGGVTGYIGSIVDIHARKELEEQLAERTRALRSSERRQGAFLEMLSHELRNPLAPIANASSVLRTLEVGNPLLARLRMILDRQVERLGQLIGDLIDATRTAQGHIALISEIVPVECIVQGAIDASAEQVRRFGHRVDVDLPTGPMRVKGDPGRLVQALGNLLSNAARFTPTPSAIELQVSTSGGHVQFIVRDAGQGIEADFLPYVFDLFAQEEQAFGRKPAGLGVGLTLARRIALLHGGSVAAYSAGRGRGACFVLALPLAAGEPVSPPTSDVPTLIDSYRVLIIENDAAGRESLRLQMQSWGNEVRVATRADEGLALAREFKPHIVLCDLGLPGLDRGGLLEPLRTALQAQHPIVAAVTGYGQHDDEMRALAMGYDSFLVKPLQPGSLVRLLRSYTSGVRSADAAPRPMASTLA